LLFDTGRWADALAEVQALDESLKEPGAACIDHSIAATICFHRGDTDAARIYPTAATALYAQRIGNRYVAPVARWPAASTARPLTTFRARWRC
jgi:hypothetical protein